MPPPPPPTAGDAEKGSLRSLLTAAFSASPDDYDDDSDGSAAAAAAEAARELSVIQAAVRADLLLVNAAKNGCVAAVDLAFAATKVRHSCDKKKACN